MKVKKAKRVTIAKGHVYHSPFSWDSHWARLLKSKQVERMIPGVFLYHVDSVSHRSQWITLSAIGMGYGIGVSLTLFRDAVERGIVKRVYKG